MSDTGQSQSGFPFAQWVPAGEDRFGEYRGLGISRIDFKLSAQDSDGNLLILENSFREKGGPAPALALRAGRVVLRGGRRVHHRGRSAALPAQAGRFSACSARFLTFWAFAGGGLGRILIAFTPAGKMEAFFAR